MAVETRGQLALDEELVEDDDLEATLERRQARREAVSDATADFREADKEAELAIAEKFGQIEDGAVYRVGRFRIEKKVTPARSVSFETEPKERISIGLADGETSE